MKRKKVMMMFELYEKTLKISKQSEQPISVGFKGLSVFTLLKGCLKSGIFLSKKYLKCYQFLKP